MASVGLLRIKVDWHNLDTGPFPTFRVSRRCYWRWLQRAVIEYEA